jgi:hypothetical protein
VVDQRICVAAQALQWVAVCQPSGDQLDGKCQASSVIGHGATRDRAQQIYEAGVKFVLLLNNHRKARFPQGFAKRLESAIRGLRIQRDPTKKRAHKSTKWCAVTMLVVNKVHGHGSRNAQTGVSQPA